jgi:putative hydrolases of HD superfamily
MTGKARLESQIDFILAVDRLKQVIRQNPLADGSRRENTAEHSWHLSLAAMVLSEHAAEPVDVSRVVRMLLVHDLVEIDAGDTFIYQAMEAGVRAEQAIREREAADRIFGLLPPDQQAALRAIWDEFEELRTPEAKFAKAVDRLAPMLLNDASGGGSWRRHAIDPAQTHALVDGQMVAGSPALATFAHRLIDRAAAAGKYRPE